jgi:hypothetical protein
MKAKAADIGTKDPKKLYAIAEKILNGAGGLGIYDTWIHVDCRGGAGQRWDKRS